MKTSKFMALAIGAMIVCNAFANYNSSEPVIRQDSIALYNTLIARADSCYMRQDFAIASDFFDKAFSIGIEPIDTHLYNGACAAALSGDCATAFDRLFARVRLYPRWYSDRIANDRDLICLHDTPQWKELCDTMQARKAFFERNYDHALKARLDSVHYRDQMPRHAYIAALRAMPQDSLSVKSRLREMQHADSINRIEVFDILDTYGWPSSEIVGSSNFAIWEVIQHTSLDAIEEYLPVFRDAAANNELNKSFVAMMQDRCDMWRNRPQKYGTQGIRDENGVFVPYTLLDPEKVEQWRAEMDLPPLQEYIRQMNRPCHSE